MTHPNIRFVQCISPVGLHKMAYKEWGDPRNSKVLVCVHGLTRVSDDFDPMARELSSDYRVVCPDVVGRGRSDWLKNPQFYRIPQYVSDMVTLLARVLGNTGEERVDWFGTSMGGLIGMALASLPGSPVRKLLLNDIGPALDPVALKRIGEYLGQPMRFQTFEEAEKSIRTISATFGPHTDEEWHKLASDVLCQDQEGFWTRNYDLDLAIPFQSSTSETMKVDEAMLWAAYDAIKCPTLLIRGAQSDLLSVQTAREMTERGPKARLIEFPEVGHAPTFVHAEQIAIAKNFLLA